MLDDGEDAVGEDAVGDRRLPLGAKRNVGCAARNGELIAHWDDDDWIAPNRLSSQVQQLLQSDADVCGAGELLHYGLDTGEAWLYRRSPHERPWVAGGTLLYRRDAWARTPFSEIDVGEDEDFIARQLAERIHAAFDHSFYIALIHRGNTSRKRLADPHWQRCPFDDVSRLLAADRHFYAAARNGPQLQAGSCRSPVESVTLAAPFSVYDGYGSMAEFLALGMLRAGATINIVPLSVDAPRSVQPAARAPRTIETRSERSRSVFLLAASRARAVSVCHGERGAVRSSSMPIVFAVSAKPSNA